MKDELKFLAVNLHGRLTTLVTCLLLAVIVSADEPANDLILVLDSSNSMWGQIDADNRVAIIGNVENVDHRQANDIFEKAICESIY